jgi:hypothetical protein
MKMAKIGEQINHVNEVIIIIANKINFVTVLFMMVRKVYLKLKWVSVKN